MIRQFTIAAALLSFAMSAPLAAQAQMATQPGGDLAIGEDVPAVTPLQPDVRVEKVGDWDVQCSDANGITSCQIYQLLNDTVGNPISEVVLFPLFNQLPAVAGATVLVPLETLLTAQLTVSIDGQAAKRYPFSFCNTVGCYARLGLTQEDLDTYRKGDTAVFSIIPALAPDQVVTITVSLGGFNAAFEKAAVPE